MPTNTYFTQKYTYWRKYLFLEGLPQKPCFYEYCENFREFLLTADLGRGHPRVGEAHEGGPLPGAGPHREQVVERREGETAGQTLHRTTQDSVCRTYLFILLLNFFLNQATFNSSELLKNI